MPAYKTCKNCFKVKDLDEYADLKYKGKPYKRLVCKTCRSGIQYQRYLSVKYFNNVKSIYQCECSNYYSDVTHSFNQCKECRIYNNENRQEIYSR